ncbi:APO protein 3, mitochondrial [Trifolium repens]|nr:APO protein 3, mitochondrial [Trifolium repens]
MTCNNWERPLIKSFQASNTSYATGTRSGTSNPFFGGSRGFSIPLLVSFLLIFAACLICLKGIGYGFFFPFGNFGGKSTFWVDCFCVHTDSSGLSFRLAQSITPGNVDLHLSNC